jgi:hypothetical protein
MKGILSVPSGSPGRNGTEVPGMESIAKASKTARLRSVDCVIKSGCLESMSAVWFPAWSETFQ